MASRDDSSRRRRSRSHSKERKRSKEKDLPERRKKKRSTAWDDPSAPVVPGQALPPVVPSPHSVLLGSTDPVAKKYGLPVLANMKWGEPGQSTPPPKYPLKAPPKVYACALPRSCTAEVLQGLFSPFGVIKSIELAEKTGFRYAILEFTSESSAERCIPKLDGHVMRGTRLKVGRALPSPILPGGAMAGYNSFGSSFHQDSIEENTLVSGGSARMNLMRKLMRGDKEPEVFRQFTAQPDSSVPLRPPPDPVALTTVQAGLSESPSRCVVLKNLVGSPAEVDDQLGEEVRDECSKFGKVEHLLIYDEARPVTGVPEVFIFVLYATFESACQATAKLNRRFFARRQIGCYFFDERAFRKLMES